MAYKHNDIHVTHIKKVIELNPGITISGILYYKDWDISEWTLRRTLSIMKKKNIVSMTKEGKQPAQWFLAERK